MSKTAFQFPPEIRPYVRSLTDLMNYANSRNDGKWANQSSDPAYNGVYGNAHNTIVAIVREVCGQDVVDRLDTWNFGGSGCWLTDVEDGVQDAIDRYIEDVNAEGE